MHFLRTFANASTYLSVGETDDRIGNPCVQRRSLAKKPPAEHTKDSPRFEHLRVSQPMG